MGVDVNPLFGGLFLPLEGTGLDCCQEWKTRQVGLWVLPSVIIPVSVSILHSFILFLFRRVHFRIFPASCKVLFNSTKDFSLFILET